MPKPRVPLTYQRSGDSQDPGHCVQFLGKHLPCLPDKGKEAVKKYICGECEFP